MYAETNDYSYDAINDQSNVFQVWSHVTLYQNGVLMWGTEP